MMAVAVFMTSCEREYIVEDDVDGWRTSPLDNDESTIGLRGDGDCPDCALTPAPANMPLYCDPELYRDFSFECNCEYILQYADVSGDETISPVDLLLWNGLLIWNDVNNDLELDIDDNLLNVTTVLNTQIHINDIYSAAGISGSIGINRSFSCEDIACIQRYILAIVSC